MTLSSATTPRAANSRRMRSVFHVVREGGESTAAEEGFDARNGRKRVEGGSVWCTHAHGGTWNVHSRTHAQHLALRLYRTRNPCCRPHYYYYHKQHVEIAAHKQMCRPLPSMHSTSQATTCYSRMHAPLPLPPLALLLGSTTVTVRLDWGTLLELPAKPQQAARRVEQAQSRAIRRGKGVFVHSKQMQCGKPAREARWHSAASLCEHCRILTTLGDSQAQRSKRGVRSVTAGAWLRYPQTSISTIAVSPMLAQQPGTN